MVPMRPAKKRASCIEVPTPTPPHYRAFRLGLDPGLQMIEPCAAFRTDRGRGVESPMQMTDAAGSTMVSCSSCALFARGHDRAWIDSAGVRADPFLWKGRRPMPAPDMRSGPRAQRTSSPVETWVERDGQWLHRLLRRSLRLPAAEVEDIVQETWLRVLRAPPAEVAHPRAFLSRIALNLFRDGHRREKLRREKAHLLAANDITAVPSQALHEQEADRLLEQIITDLPQPLRDVFVLSRFRRMTNHDIAAHLGISVKTVEWRMGKAMEQCMTRLRG